MMKEESFGIIPLIYREGQWEVLLIQHTRGSYWGFPKGHAEEGESSRETALRELKEETNLEPVRYLWEDPFVEQYSFIRKGKRIFKTVSYFVAEVQGEICLQPEEIQKGIWVPLSQATGQITHAEGKAILTRIEQSLSGM